MSNSTLSFDDALRAYVHCDEPHAYEACIKRCIESATTFEQLHHVFFVCADSPDDTIHLRPLVLERMIKLSKTVEQAEQALNLCEPINGRAKGYPRRLEEAKERIEQLKAELQPA